MEKSQEEKPVFSYVGIRHGETKEERRERVEKEGLAYYKALLAYWREHPDELEDYVVD